jgi:PAS domain S-box-containing protein
VTASLINRAIQAGVFDQAPITIAVIDKEFNIVEANRAFEETYGPWKGKKCFEAYKRGKEQCSECPAPDTFEDGKVRVWEEERNDKDGELSHQLVRFFPLKEEAGDILYVVEMSSDISHRVAIEKELDFLFEHVPCYITVLDKDLKIIKSNRFFDDKFRREGKQYCYEMYKCRDKRCKDCPAVKAFDLRETHSTLQMGVDREGNTSHYMVTTAPLEYDSKGVTSVIEIAADLSEVLDLRNKLEKAEQERIEAERLAAVGQTVAGLSHGIKNIIMGLEGGMYVVNSGLTRDDQGLMKSGWEMLENNISKISSFVTEFLSFAKGSEPELELVEPIEIAEQVVSLYSETARQSGIELVGSFPRRVKKANMDPAGIHTALANLVSNAVDACLVSDHRDLKVVLSCYERGDTIYYKVEDNGCGMDYDVKKKIFTSFFTTKGSGQGTGLGLLVTRKIVSQHGGEIRVRSSQAGGSEFRLKFPRERLPRAKRRKE